MAPLLVIFKIIFHHKINQQFRDYLNVVLVENVAAITGAPALPWLRLVAYRGHIVAGLYASPMPSSLTRRLQVDE